MSIDTLQNQLGRDAHVCISLAWGHAQEGVPYLCWGGETHPACGGCGFLVWAMDWTKRKEPAEFILHSLFPGGTQCDQLPASAAGAPLSWWAVTWDGELMNWIKPIGKVVFNQGILSQQLNRKLRQWLKVLSTWGTFNSYAKSRKFECSLWVWVSVIPVMYGLFLRTDVGELSTAVIRAAHWTTCTHHIPTGVLIDRAVDVQGPAAAAAASCPCGYVSSCVSSHSAWGQVLHPDIVIWCLFWQNAQLWNVPMRYRKSDD